MSSIFNFGGGGGNIEMSVKLLKSDLKQCIMIL